MPLHEWKDVAFQLHNSNLGTQQNASRYMFGILGKIFYPPSDSEIPHFAESIWSISPFWLYRDTIFFAYDGMCWSALHQPKLENQMLNLWFIIILYQTFHFKLPLFSPCTIHMKIISDGVVIQGITGKFKTLRPNLQHKISVRICNCFAVSL